MVQIAHASSTVDTAGARRGQFLAGRTAALESTGLVDARTVQAVVRVVTLVDVCTISSGCVQFIAGPTAALEVTDRIVAFAVDAEIAEHITFVDVGTRSFFVDGCISHVTFTAISARVVDALAVNTDVRINRTLVDVDALEPVAFESLVADTPETARRVDAGGVDVTAAVVRETLIYVGTLESCSGKSCRASTLVGADGVEADTVDVTLVLIRFTFINVFTLCARRGDTIAGLTFAFV
jgi:hypothetical protein